MHNIVYIKKEKRRLFHKKILALIMVFAIALCAVGCGKKDAKKQHAKRDLLPEIEHETGYMGEKNVAYIPYEDGIYTTEYDDEADALRKEILAHPDSKVPYDNVKLVEKGTTTNLLTNADFKVDSIKDLHHEVLGGSGWHIAEAALDDDDVTPYELVDFRNEFIGLNEGAVTVVILAKKGVIKFKKN